MGKRGGLSLGGILASQYVSEHRRNIYVCRRMGNTIAAAFLLQ